MRYELLLPSELGTGGSGASRPRCFETIQEVFFEDEKEGEIFVQVKIMTVHFSVQQDNARS